MSGEGWLPCRRQLFARCIVCDDAGNRGILCDAAEIMNPVPCPADVTVEKPVKRKQWRRIWKGAGIVVTVLLVAAGLGGRVVLERVLPYAIIGETRVLRDVTYRGVTPEKVGSRAEKIEVEVEPGMRLAGGFVRADGSAKGTVLLLHGHNSCKEAMLPLAKLLAKDEFNSFAYDSRGCRESGGQYGTYGFYEKRDCSRCLDELLRRYRTEVGPVSIFGNSYGGAVAVQTMAEDQRFRCGVVESTFATLREVVRDYEKNITGVRLDALCDAALDRAGIIAHFPPDAVKPEEAARLIRCSVMVVHGTVDADVATRYGQRVFKNLSVPGSRWYPITGAGHGNLWDKGGDAYRQAVLDFLDAHGR